VLSLEHIRTLCSGNISISEPLARMTSFRIGGSVDIYIEPETTEELAALMRYLHDADARVIVLGNGSNVLVSDEGFRGVAISIEKGFSDIALEKDIVHAGAGIRLSLFVDFCISHGLAGTEMLAGIPGTLGGALIMNAGAYGGEISDYLIDVTVLRDCEPIVLPRERCAFSYRDSDLKRDIVLSARFAFPAGEATALRAERKELLLKRKRAQPISRPNAGSIFKNPPGRFAAKLIDECGLKGYTIGGASVSDVHANFIVNDGNASAKDVVALINHLRRVVYERTGVILETEIQLIGFPDDIIEPLM